MSSGRRKELERKRRKLEKEGVVRFEAAAPDQAAFEPLYQEFVELEGSGWKAANGTAIAQKPASFRFYRDYGRRLCELGMLRLFLLRLNGELVAAQYHVLHAGKLWELKIAYREALGRHSPGALLTHEILRWGCEHGVRGLEHLGAAEEWQTRWPVETREHSTVRLYPAGPVGGVALAWDSADFLRRRVQARRGGPAEPQETGESANS
jgi:CelD/BcsL family acetyltransferase involved in cellulose biosynthesis